MGTIKLEKKVVAENIAHLLLTTKSVVLQPRIPKKKSFTFGNGWNAPIIWNTLSPETMKKIKEQICFLIMYNFMARVPYESLDGIIGFDKKETSLAKASADKINLSYYHIDVEKESQLTIEGETNLFNKETPVIIIQNILSDSEKSLKAASIIQSIAQVIGVFTLFSYGFQKTSDAFASTPFDVHALCDYATLLKVAEEIKCITTEERELLHLWHADPKAYAMMQQHDLLQ